MSREPGVPPPRRRPWVLSGGAFEKLLRVLGPDREAAGERYETLRSGLIHLFEWRGCRAAETLADTTIDRVCRRIDEGKDIDPARAEAYFHGVARNVAKEYFYRIRKQLEVCLKQCLAGHGPLGAGQKGPRG